MFVLRKGTQVNKFSRRSVGAALATVGLVAGVGVATAGSASADNPRQGGSTEVKVKAVVAGNRLDFKGPKSVERGAKLTFVNKTDPEEIGPHTFSLVKRNLIPKGAREQGECYDGPRALCNRILRRHDIDFETETIGKPKVDVRKRGWDKSFGRRGDSFFTEKRGQKHTRKVKADKGETLYYFCAIHPNMKGKIDVE